jgi:2-dehydro-3-deoxyphosphooctonate aldolase (KDO 8-P synthase)
MSKHITIFKPHALTVIAGPCMLESKETAEAVITALQTACAAHGVPYVFKSSFDKANRTSGSSLRGPGLERGLKWMAELAHKHKLLTLTDIHTPQQAQAAAEVVDVLQIPAFLCEDRALLSAAARTGRTVQVKKGQFTSPERMLDIAHFLKQEGAVEISLCERGSCFGYHNLIVDFRNFDVMKRSGHPVVFDATHAAQLPGAGQGVSSGKREHIPSLARAAAAVGLSGLFMEVHPEPTQALSDKDTQLTPSEALSLLADVVALDRCTRSLPLRKTSADQ